MRLLSKLDSFLAKIRSGFLPEYLNYVFLYAHPMYGHCAEYLPNFIIFGKSLPWKKDHSNSNFALCAIFIFGCSKSGGMLYPTFLFETRPNVDIIWNTQLNQMCTYELQ